MWVGVSGSVGVAGGALGAGAEGMAASGWAATAKMLALGTLLGGPLTIGVALAVLRVGSAPVTPSLVSHTAVVAVAPARTVSFDEGAQGGLRSVPLVAPERAPAPEARQMASSVEIQGPVAAAPPAGVRVEDVSVVRLAPLSTQPALAVAETKAPEGVRPPPGVESTGPGPARATRPTPLGDLLAREASLVAEGRSALQRGNARRALAAIHSARALPSHQLEPEELAVEIQSLRALGREREAVQTEVVLKVSYPESDLGR
jgi:hypothetical protein